MTDDRYLELVGASIALIAGDASASREPLDGYTGRLTSIADQNRAAWNADPADGRSFHRMSLAEHLARACRALLAGQHSLAMYHLIVGADHIGK